MAELLIMSRDNNGVGVGQYKRGDIVDVREDGSPYGAKELRLYADGGMFVRLKLPGVAVAKVLAYTDPEYALQDPQNAIIKRRLWGLLIDSIPVGVRTTLINTGEYTTTVAEIRDFVENKVTLAKADFNG